MKQKKTKKTKKNKKIGKKQDECYTVPNVSECER